MSEIEKIIADGEKDTTKVEEPKVTEKVVEKNTADTDSIQKQLKELQFDNSFRDLLQSSPVIKDYKDEIKQKVSDFGITVGDAALLVLNSHKQLTSYTDTLGGSAPTVTHSPKNPETREELANAVRDYIERGEIQFN